MALSAAGCGQSTGAAELPEGLTRAEFVKVIEGLRGAPPAERAAIYKKHRTSEAEIRAYITALSTDPVALSEVLDTLQLRIGREQFIDPTKVPDLPKE